MLSNPTSEQSFIFHDGYDYKPTIIVLYQSMTNIESANEDKISAFRVAMLGIVGGLWKKKHVYTVIQYKDKIRRKSRCSRFW